MADPTTMKAQVVPSKGRPSLLVLVDDPDLDELVVVRWRLDQASRFQCSADQASGRVCAHIAAAVPVMRDHLFGPAAAQLLTTTPTQAPKAQTKR